MWDLSTAGGCVVSQSPAPGLSSRGATSARPLQGRANSHLADSSAERFLNILLGRCFSFTITSIVELTISLSNYTREGLDTCNRTENATGPSAGAGYCPESRFPTAEPRHRVGAALYLTATVAPGAIPARDQIQRFK